jgi:hypothetical protein
MRVLGFKVMATPGEKEGNGSKTRKEGGVVNRVMTTLRKGGKC